MRASLPFAAFFLSSLSFLIACGSGSHSAPQNPVFTSIPVTAASQGMSYSYTLAATDPAGGTVTFSLPTAPSGATITGSTINWTPAAAESRLSNNFEAMATTSSGGSATQSWKVTPTGTVTVNWVNTDWTPAGPVQIPQPATFLPSALVPQADGSLQLITGTSVSPGVFQITQVPAGYYWLVQGLPQGLSLPPTAFWTSSSSFDLGRDRVGASTGILPSSQTITLNFNLSGLAPSATPGVVGFLTDNPPVPPIYLTATPGQSTLTASASLKSNIDWTTVNTGFLGQYEPSSLGTFNNLVLGPTLSLPNMQLTNGAPNSINGTLAASPTASVNLNIPGSQWATMMQNVGPGAATAIGSSLSIAAEPYVVGANAKAAIFAPTVGATLYMVQPDPPSGVPFALSACPSMPFLFSDAIEPAVTADTNFGTLSYGDPYPSNWTRALLFCQSVSVPFPGLPQGFGMALNYSVVSDPAKPTLAPLVGPVASPTINGSSLFTTTSVNSTTETLSWSAASGSPFGYTVIVFQLIPIQNGLEFLVVGTYSTAQTSMTLPPLTAGDTYVFLIITQADAAANIQTSPYHSQLPTGSATVISNPILVNSGAAAPQLRGDPKQWQRFLHPKGEVYRISDGQMWKDHN